MAGNDTRSKALPSVTSGEHRDPLVGYQASQRGVLHGVASVFVQNIRHWLAVIESQPKFDHGSMRFCIAVDHGAIAL